ncbi:hypothetical protein ACWDFL_03255 [Streptomyces bungoensis]
MHGAPATTVQEWRGPDSRNDVRLRAFTDHIRLEVRDSDTNPPIPSPLSLAEEENAEAEHGRGMLIVEAPAEMWSSSPTGLGKIVSMSMPIAPP